MKPNITSLGYGLFLAINAAGVWGGVFPFLPMEFQTTEIVFWFFLAQLNFILGVLNLVPLLPFDGGHIAIALYEKLRNLVRSARGKVAAAPVNYMKLMPATYVVLVVVVGYMLLTVTADLVNPIRLF